MFNKKEDRIEELEGELRRLKMLQCEEKTAYICKISDLTCKLNNAEKQNKKLKRLLYNARNKFVRYELELNTLSNKIAIHRSKLEEG